MGKFDLEKAKAGYPVRTRDGHEARIICFDREPECFRDIIPDNAKWNNNKQ